MNPTLIKLAQFVAKRPKDWTIRLMHILTGIIVALLLWWAQDLSVIDVPFMGSQSPETELKIEYGLLVFGIVFFLRGIIPFCLLKHKWIRWLQWALGFALIIIGGPMMDPIVTKATPQISSEGGFQIQADSIETETFHPGIFLIFIGIFWIFVWLSGKGTTSKCLQYGEVIKKVRV